MSKVISYVNRWEYDKISQPQDISTRSYVILDQL